MASEAAGIAHGAPNEASPLSKSVEQRQYGELDEDFDTGVTQQGSSTLGGDSSGGLRRGNSTISQSHTLTPSRGGTLKKKQSLKKKGSLRRSASAKSSRPGSIRSFRSDQEAYAGDHGEMNNAFFTPVPTTGSPTDILANRFQAWRKVLKDLITYFRDIQKSYETRSKSLYTLSNVINNISAPPVFLSEGGIGDATHILRDYHKQSINEGNKAKTLEEDVVVQLTGLRSDLAQKIKEIKSLSGDFKNNVDKETEATRRAVRDLQEALGIAETDPHASSGKGDPYIVKLGVDRQVGRQIEEENYLHRAFLNLESSGRELESIVIGEIQKAYNAYAGILGREADEAYEAVEKLRTGPIAMPKDHEWDSFVNKNEHFVDPKLPVRRVENITYPGKDNPAALEVKSGMLERKSKYLKSYTPGWYVLSPTHLHEFKSPDHVSSQSPVMSLYLRDQKLGSHSAVDSTSHKFMLKGRQTGGMHRGHSWVFRAESYDTMMAWFEDIKNLTEKTGAERNAFIRQHARSASAGSQKAGSISSEGAMEEDEADAVPYSATASQVDPETLQQEKRAERPNPGGRFPSALNINRDSQVPVSPSSPSSSGDRDIVAAAGLPGSGVPFGQSGQQVQTGDDEAHESGEIAGAVGQPSNYYANSQVDRSHLRSPSREAALAPMHEDDGVLVGNRQQSNESVQKGVNPLISDAPNNEAPVQSQGVSSDEPGAVAYATPRAQQQPPAAVPRSLPHHVERHDSQYGDWMAPAAAGFGGAAVGATTVEAYRNNQTVAKEPEHDTDQPSQIAQTEPVYSTTTSTHPLPDNAAWAGGPTVAPVLPIIGDSPEDPFGSRRPSETLQQVPGNGNHAGLTQAAPVLASIGAYNDESVESRVPDTVTEEAQTPGGTLNDPGAPIKALAARPPFNTHPSATTISDLHVPGEFPKKDVV